MAEWQDRALDMLTDGYGVEDIALKLRVEPARVRSYVSELRTSGLLEELFSDA